MKKMYRVDWGREIKEFDVVKETTQTVTYIDYWNGKITERRTNKVTDYHRWFASREMAVANIREKLLIEISNCEKRIAAARESIAELDRG